jgi:uncharacterized membrane protein
MASRAGQRDTASVMAALGVALSFTPSLLARRRQDQVLVSLGSAAVGAVTGAAVEAVVARAGRHLPGGRGTARIALAGAGALAVALRLPRHPLPGVAAAGTASAVAGGGALLGAVAPRRRRIGGIGIVATAATGLLGARAVWARLRPRRPRLAAYPAAHYLDSVSGGEGSLVPRSSLDYEGTRFLAGAVGGLPSDPVRVFVGVQSAPAPATRAELAAAELDRLGGFRRRRVVVCSATLRGYVNPIATAAAEMLADGDIAIVTVQYHDRRTLLMPLKVPIAAETHAELLSAMRRRIDALDGPRPELVVYGESLGAWGSQEVFGDGGVEALRACGVDRALWVGTPWFSRFVRRARRGLIPVDDTMRFLDTHELVHADPPDAGRIRYAFLWRSTDPVTLFSGLSLLWRRPAWLTTEGRARRGIPADVRWIPGVTFVQVAVDVIRSTNWTSARPQSVAHDYRREVPLAVNLVFGLGADRERVEAVATAVTERELDLQARVRAIRRGAAG